MSSDGYLNKFMQMADIISFAANLFLFQFFGIRISYVYSEVRCSAVK